MGTIGQVLEGAWGETYKVIRELLLASEHRGRDATGFVASTVPLDYPERRGIVMAKQPLPASDFVDSDRRFRSLHHRRCDAFLGHVRAATHGDPLAAGNVNNHPFVSRDGSLFLVHNGVLQNHEEVADKFSLRLSGQCDSEVLVRLAELSESPADGLTDCLTEAQGSMAVAVYDRTSGSIWLARNSGRPLWLLRLKRERRWFFASTDGVLLRAMRESFGPSSLKRVEYLAPIPEHVPMELRPDGSILAAAGQALSY